MAERRTAQPRPRIWISLLALLLLGGCQGPVSQPRPEGSQGAFPGSQVKPPPSPRPPLLPLPALASRREARQRYFGERPLAGAAAKAALLGSSQAALQAGRRDLRAGALPHLSLQLQAGQQIEVETRGLSDGADPVLHLFSREAQREVARDDDGGTEAGAARLRHRVEQAGTYLVLLRAYAAADEGHCELIVDGRSRGRVGFGGSSLPVGAGRELFAVLLNDGAGEEPWPPSGRAATDPLLGLLDPVSGELLAIDDDSGVELGSRLRVGEREVLALLGAYSEGDAGAARLLVNDPGDSDGDGLGDGLEAALCTCSGSGPVACGFSCLELGTTQDSDGDGLSDAEEVLGVDHPRFPQLLPRWGADPRHKDLFVELDLADWLDVADTPPVRRRGRSLATEDAHAAARAFARLDQMHNPDGQEGIRLHLDVGHPCGTADSGIDAVCGDLCALGQDGVRRCGQSTYPGPPASPRAGLAEGRAHLFHLALADCAIAGQAPGGPADFLEYDCDRFTALVHELGHNLGLSHHYGTPQTGGGNCKPNYPSLMNYAYSDGFGGGRELRFSSGQLLAAGDLDPRGLDETRPFGGEQAEVGWLATRPFFFKLHDCQAPGRGCKVDFNRDGRLDPSVRAHLSPMPGYGSICEGAHGNALGSENLEGLAASSGPAGAELLRRRPDGSLAPALHAIAPQAAPGGSRLWLSHSFQTSGGWSAWQELPGPLFRKDAQPAAATVAIGGGEQLWVVACVEGEDPIRAARLDSEGQLTPFEVVPGQPAGLRAREVSLAVRGPDLLLLVRDERPGAGDGVLIATRSPSGWGAFLPVQVEGAPLRSRETPAAAFAADGRFYLVSADPDPPPGSGPPGRIHLHSGLAGEPHRLRDEELAGLRFEDGVPGHQHEAWSRPALAFLPHLDGGGLPLPEAGGALWLFWIRALRTRYLWSWGRLDQSGADFSLGRWHHYEAYGYTDAIAGSGPALVVRRSGHLAALLAQSDLTPARVRHVPFVEGAPDEKLVLRDHDDRPVIRSGLCLGLNWECPARCQRLSDACQAAGQAGPPVRCSLPVWPVEAEP